MANHEAERARLARIYSEMSDTGLAELAAEAGSLTQVAREVLKAQLEARGTPLELVLPTPSETKIAPEKISGPPVMVKRFRDFPEALIAESLLDSAGIDCFLADEFTIRMNWFWSNLLGGLKLIVRFEDFEDAKSFLEAPVSSEMRTDERQEGSANKMEEPSE